MSAVALLMTITTMVVKHTHNHMNIFSVVKHEIFQVIVGMLLCCFEVCKHGDQEGQYDSL